MTTFDKVKKIVKGHFFLKDDSVVTMDTRFIEDLEADSLDMVQMINFFEEVTGVDIDDCEAAKIKTVRDAVEAIDKAVTNASCN